MSVICNKEQTMGQILKRAFIPEYDGVPVSCQLLFMALIIMEFFADYVCILSGSKKAGTVYDSFPL